MPVQACLSTKAKPGAKAALRVKVRPVFALLLVLQVSRTAGLFVLSCPLLP